MPFNWYFPVIGKTEYSGGSWMPDSLTHRGRTHAAMDIYAERGSAIIAPVSGVIETVKTSEIGGHTVTFKGDDGMTYYFAHMDAPSSAVQGQRMNIGGYLGVVGNSGSASSTKPHLHFSIKKNGAPINPKHLLDAGYVMPESAFEASMGSPDPYPNVAYMADLEYVDPMTVAETALADSEPYEAPTEMSAGQFFGNVMEGFAAYATGGAQRADYMAVGQSNVPRTQLQVNVAGSLRNEEEGAAEDGEMV